MDNIDADLIKLERDIKRMKKFPTTVVTKSVKAGGRMLKAKTKENAPKESHELSRSIVMRLEKSKTKGKRVVDITYKANEKLVKISKEGKRSYYPASQEFGWITKSGKKIQGLHFMRKTADENAAEFNKIAMKELIDGIERIWRNG